LPSWGEILEEVQQTAQPGDVDAIRRKYLVELHGLTGRATILYETDWLMGGPPGISITPEDMVAMMEVCRDMGDGPLDLIVHSPGGSAEATASIVRYLRKQFSEVRVIVPHAAMSAATMLALSADVIVMGKQSQLGPIDPQLVTAQGQAIPARAILDQFERAKKECSEDSSVLGAWMPMLQQYGPALLEQCQNADALAKRLVKEWLRTYMFKDEKYAARKALKVAKFFGDHHIHQSHSLGIDRSEAREKGVKIIELESDPAFEDAVLSVHYATFHTFSGPAIKIVENHRGGGFFKVAQQVQIPMGPGGMVPMMPPQGLFPPAQP
jgi:Serine dehydrogenase proteinase